VPATVVLLGALAVACIPAAQLLAGADWPRRCPVAGIALWQALGLGWGLAAVGALAGFGLSGPIAPGGLQAILRLLSLAASLALLTLLCWILAAAIAVVLKARHRQRTLLGLLAHDDPKVPGALVVDYPAAAAYCVPGLRSAIVISAGALDLLDADELAAVLAHERAHLRARHDLVLLPFTALLRAFRWSATARAANAEVALLVEMLADDRARRCRPARELATALLRVGASGGGQAPLGALAATGAALDGDLAARVARLLRPPPGLPFPAIVAVGVLTALLVLTPAAALLLPF
jgi:Zn-dependent protease with chaperone function